MSRTVEASRSIRSMTDVPRAPSKRINAGSAANNEGPSDDKLRLNYGTRETDTPYSPPELPGHCRRRQPPPMCRRRTRSWDRRSQTLTRRPEDRSEPNGVKSESTKHQRERAHWIRRKEAIGYCLASTMAVLSTRKFTKLPGTDKFTRYQTRCCVFPAVISSQSPNAEPPRTACGHCSSSS